MIGPRIRLPLPIKRLATWMVLIPLMLLACTQQQLLDKASYPEDRALARAALSDLRSGNATSLASRVPTELRSKLGAVLPQMRAALPDAGEQQVELVDARFTNTIVAGQAPSRQAYLAYEVSGSDQYALAQFSIQRNGATASITEMYVTRISGPTSTINAFTLSGKTPAAYAILLSAVGVVGVTIAALFRIWRRRDQFGRRWLWTLGCLLGLTKLTLNWTTGEFSFDPLFVQLFSASVIRPGLLAPWLVGVSLPVVAIYVLFRRRRPAN